MLFFELLQVVLGNRERLCLVPTAAEWTQIYAESERQAVTGILLYGIDRLPVEQRPPQALLLQWIGVGQMIEQRNRVMDERCVELLGRIREVGLRGTILKGQGIARLYNLDDNLNDNLNGNLNLDKKGSLGKLRQPGDIDVYVSDGREKAIAYAKSLGQKDIDWDYKHLHLQIWSDTEVEMHYHVEVLLNLWKNRKLQKWFAKHREAMFCNLNDNHNLDLNSNTNRTNDTNGFVTPTVEFNVFYILLHIYRHFLYEGVGLRQIIDYYMVLRTVHTFELPVQEYIEAVREFGMVKFAKGLMWVIHEALGMPREWMLWEPDEKEGKYILKQVMAGGNFGHHDKRLSHSGGKLGAVKAILTHNLHLLTHYPADVIWAPVWIVWHRLWKIKAKASLSLRKM